MKYQKIRDLIKPLTEFSLRNRWVLMIIDFFVSAFSLVIVYLLHNKYATIKISPDEFVYVSIVYLIIGFFASYFCRTCRGLVRHLQFQNIGKLGISMFVPSMFLFLFFQILMPRLQYIPIFVLTLFLLNLVLVLYTRYWLIYVYNFANYSLKIVKKNTMVYGIKEHSFSIVQWLSKSPGNTYNIIGYLSKMRGVNNTMIDEIPVFDISKENIFEVLTDKNVSVIIFPSYKAVRNEHAFLSTCMSNGISILVAPPLEDVQNPNSIGFQMKPIQFEDLLGRDEISLDMGLIKEQLHCKVILVTGAAGSIGSELVRQIAAFRPAKIILFDIAESPLHDLKLELETDFPNLKFIPVIGDVRNHNRLNHVFANYKPQVVYHAAAYKHVPLMEMNPCEAVIANICGTRNVADFALRYHVERFVMVSTDKAVNPTNIMGASKRIAEIYVQSLSGSLEASENKTVFVTTRFGNVLGSNGSVIPRFKKQIEAGGPVTVTHPDIIRYFMTIPEACRLVLEAGSFGHSGEVYVFDMGQPVKIVDLARRMIEMAGLIPDKDISIRFTGLREGEKLYEELLCNNETTLPTKHDKIKVANVAKYNFEEVSAIVNSLITYSSLIDVPNTVRTMKKLVPEFVSNNSPFSVYDL